MPRRAPSAAAPPPPSDFRELIASAEFAVTHSRRGDRGQPLGPRAEASRRRLIAAARELFYERGYARTTASDVAAAAGCSLASFYSYFADLNDVLRALVIDFLEESSRRDIGRWSVTEGRRGLRAMISAFVAHYFEHREFMLVWETARLTDPAIGELARRYTAVYKRRSAIAFETGIEAGLIRADHRAEDMADALTAMIERYCFHHIVLLRDELATVIESATLLTDLWADSIDLVEPGAARPGTP